jgi:hypothetical protein
VAIIPEGFGQVLVPLRNAGAGHVSAITFGVDFTVAATDPQDEADTIAGVVYPRLAPCQDSDVTIGPLEVRYRQGGNEFVGIAATTDTGDQSFNSPPPNNSVIVAKNGAAAGRRNKGRFFLPWALDRTDMNEAGGIVPARVTQIQGEMTTLLGDLVGIDREMVILHSTAGTPAVVVGLVVSALIGSQRRRLGR